MDKMEDVLTKAMRYCPNKHFHASSDPNLCVCVCHTQG